MWLLYVVSLILGGGTLLVQTMSGLGHDGHDFAAHHPLHGPGLLSTRSVTFGLFSFGLVGATVNGLGLASPASSLALASLAGLTSTLAVGLAFRILGHPSASGATAFREARGLLARVLVSCEPGKRGKIRVQLKGQAVDMLATTDEEGLPAGASVRILDVEDDVARVALVRERSSDESG